MKTARLAPSSPAPAMLRSRPNRWVQIALCTLLALLSACWQAPPAVDSTAQEVTPAGGTLVLPGGVSATFGPGFLAEAATVTLTLSDAPASYPPEIAATYQGGEAVAKSATLLLPAGALAAPGDLAAQPELTVRVPTVATHLETEEEERLLAEVHLYLADGQHLFFFEPYARVDGETGQTSEGTDAVTFRVGQLRAAVAEGDVRVTVRPVRLGATQLAPQALPSGFALETVASGLNGGVGFDFAEGGRIFIAEKRGVVKVFQNGRVQSTPFMDLSGQVNNFHDRGMLGIAVHPQFPERPYVYVLFTYDPPEVRGRSGYGGPDSGGARVARLLRLTAEASQNYNVAVPGSEVVLLGKGSTYANIGAPGARNSATPSCGAVDAYVQDCLPADEWSHTIGTLRFGTDGSLFVGNGDGTNYNAVQDYAVRALDPNSLAGKILRIDPITGEGYGDNPFYNGDRNSNRSKVLNSGLRNPFRFTINRQTNVPFVGDVGWNTWEEVNSGRGKNFGWPCYEGGNGSSLQQGGYRALAKCASYSASNVTVPVYAYNHGGGGASVQVGDFYTGSSYPEPYRNALFVVDYNGKWIRYLKLNSSGSLASVNDFASAEGMITQISARPQGDLYLIDIAGGTLKRLRYNAPETTPLVAAASATPLQGTPPLAVTFSSAGSSGLGTLRYAWNFGDGRAAAEANPSHTFAEPGVYKVSLSVSDLSGDSANASLTVRVNNSPPVATILSSATGGHYTVGDAIPFSGKGVDPEEGDLPESALSWTVKMHHNDHAHLDGLPPTTGAAGSFVSEDHGDNTYLELCLSATDAFDETGTDCVSLYPNTVAYTLDTVPTGLELPWEGTSRITPFSVMTTVNAVQQLIAPAQSGYTFASWSDGGAATHDIRIGTAAKRLVATYKGDVVKQDQTIRVTTAAPTDATVGGSTALSATATSGLAVSFSSSTSSVCTVSGSVARFVAAGTCTVRASQGGNAAYNPAPTVSQTFSVRTSTSTSRLTINPICKDRWLVRNPLSKSVVYSWKILSTGRKGSRTAPPGSEYRLWLPSGSSKVTFYTNGTLYGTLSPITKSCG